MSLEQQLQDIGLNGTEIKIYLYVLEHGISSPPQISRGTNIARSNAHQVLQSLVAANLLKRQQKGKRFVYVATDPSAVLTLFDKKRNALEASLADLTALFKEQRNKPTIRFYEGRDELQQIFEDILKTENKEVFGFASTQRLFKVIPYYFQSRFQKELKKRGIFLHDILTHESGVQVAEETKQNAAPYYDYRLIDKKYGDLPTDMLVWDDKLAVMALKEPAFGTVIENKDLADTYRAQFDIMWRTLS